VNRETALAAAPLASLTRFDHPDDAGEPHRDPPEEISPAAQINFIESGVFEIAAGRRRERFVPGEVFVTRPADAYRCRHSDASPRDVSLSLQLHAPGAADALRRLRGRIRLPASNRLAYARLRLLSAAASGDGLAFETRAAEALEAASAAPDAGAAPFRAGQLGWYSRRVDRVRELLEARFAEPRGLALEDLAREAAMSPFHFARLFRELTGTPPHRYLRNLRLEAARRLLLSGARVTDACYDAGFSSLSHFSRQFRRRYGLSPSRLTAPSRGASRS
jgi:AraC-like DNA-binding protein